MSFHDRVVLITGTRKGIGAHLARHFADLGARVVGINRQPAPLDLGRYAFHQADVAEEDQVAAVLHAIGREYGRLDVLVNNAGIASMNHSLLMPADAVESILKVNLLGTFVVAREAAKLMRRRAYGRVINMSSVVVAMQIEGESAYAASKGAVESLTRILAREYAPFGITCNAVAPPPIETDLIAGVPKEKIDAIVERLAIKRLGRVEDVAHAVEFFAREESGYVTGQVLQLGGG